MLRERCTTPATAAELLSIKLGPYCKRSREWRSRPGTPRRVRVMSSIRRPISQRRCATLATPRGFLSKRACAKRSNGIGTTPNCDEPYHGLPGASLPVVVTQKLITILITGLLAAFTAAADVEAGLNAYDQHDYATALAQWQPIAERGDPHAQYNLGL